MPKHKKHEVETLPVNRPHQNPSVPRINLATLREGALAARTDTARTIAELEAWRDEIDATIAFLRAQWK
jgi:hypothetical protein